MQISRQRRKETIMRSYWRGAVLLTSFAVLALPLAGCHHNSEGPSLVPLNANDTVATVNAQSITQSAFFTQLQNYTVNPQSPTASQPAGRSVMEQMITNLCYLGLADQQKVAPTAAEVDSQYDNFKLVQDAANIKPFEDRLAENGLSPQDFKDLQIRPQLAEVKLLNKGKAAPTDAEVKAFYDQHKADQFTKPSRAHIKVIVLSSKSDADQISKQILGGQSFDTFVPRSLNKAFVNGEFPQWVSLDDTKNVQLQPLIDSVKKTDVGKTTAPFLFQGGYWLVQVVDKKSKEVVPFDQVKSLIPYAILEERVLPQKDDTPAIQQQKFQALQELQQQEKDYEQKLAKSNEIKINLPGLQYAQMLNDIKNPPAPPLMTPTMAPGPQRVPPGKAMPSAKPSAPAKH